MTQSAMDDGAHLERVDQPNHLKPPLLIIGYLVVVTLPLILSWLVGGPARPFHKELASGLGMLAFSIILVEFVLSGRFKQISGEVGLDVTMRFHQLMANSALVFAMLHPLFYGSSPAGGQRPWDPTRQLTITTDMSDIWSGIIAYVLLPSFVLLAVFRSQLAIKYEMWRLLHGLGAVLIAGLLLHHTINAGRYGSQQIMIWVWMVFTGLAVFSLLYVYFAVPFFERSRAWHVLDVSQLSPKQWELTIAPTCGSGLDYKAGQFVWLNIGHSPFSMKENPFSLSSAPASGPNLSFMVKELGDFTRTIGQVQPGTAAYVDGAHGTLTVDGRNEPGVALIAGGIGIAPLLGILRQMRLTNDRRQVRIVYGNRAIDQIVCRPELDAEDVRYVLSEPPDGWDGETGRVSPDLLGRCFTQKEIEDWLFVICGPPKMIDDVEDYLIARGAPSHQILSERFVYD